ncbi:MAG: recombinase family protein [Defluviitaleaceae bacterium]|nr:recombinase family protein [Defluviitaleaceae bacterium]
MQMNIDPLIEVCLANSNHPPKRGDCDTSGAERINWCRNTWNAAIYVRLSKEDGDKAESDSIANQRELIKDFLKSMPEIRLCSERVDDGFSGVNFNRPRFEAMMEDIKTGKINCVIVKDLSRFGRNYIEVGKYLENIFPFLGVRFISVNDRFDSNNKRSDSEELILPFKNLINDAYSRDISVKIRSNLLIKRKNGDYIGNFVVYGYAKCTENKNKLVVDEYAAEIVRDIFKWKLEGLSGVAIAKRLNSKGELSPMEYKRFCGLNFSTSFKVNAKAQWTPLAINRILANPIYAGVLEQGKVTTPNHKLKNRITKAKEDWNIVENSHDKIISKQVFDVVADLLASDTRTAPSEKGVYVFSGKLFCADCGNTMVRKLVPSGCKKFAYYVCSTKKSGKGCTLHSTSEKELMNIVLSSIKKQISNILDIEEVLRYVEFISGIKKETKKLYAGLSIKKEELERYKNLKLSVHEDFKDGLLERYEFEEFNELYTKKLNDIQQAIEQLKNDIDIIVNGERESWIDEFKTQRNITELSRSIVSSLIKKISIHENGTVDITFMYGDKFHSTLHIDSERPVDLDAQKK